MRDLKSGILKALGGLLLTLFVLGVVGEIAVRQIPPTKIHFSGHTCEFTGFTDEPHCVAPIRQATWRDEIGFLHARKGQGQSPYRSAFNAVEFSINKQTEGLEIELISMFMPFGGCHSITGRTVFSPYDDRNNIMPQCALKKEQATGVYLLGFTMHLVGPKSDNYILRYSCIVMSKDPSQKPVRHDLEEGQLCGTDGPSQGHQPVTAISARIDPLTWREWIWRRLPEKLQ